jgi:uncharacterized protein (DUF1800 family)
MSAPQPAPFRPPGSLDVAQALTPYAGPWDARLAAHLLRRAGFGGSPADIARLAAARSPHEAVLALVRLPDTSALVPMPALPLVPRPRAKDFPGGGTDPAFLAARKSAQQQAGTELRDLQLWWLDRMIGTNAPLQEKMALFWHGHFTSARGKGVEANELAAQNELFRANALGNIHTLTLAVAQDPAMLLYLDNARNAKAHPNENFARELMELYTLGIGNYTETDVRESARAFTGWSVDANRAFTLRPRIHDDGAKTFLGRTGNFDGTDIIDIIFQQPAAATLFSRKLIEYFVYRDPEPALVDAFAAVLRANRFELQPSLATLFASNVFFSERAYRALVKSPVEFVVGTYQTFGYAQADQSALRALRGMGQILFYPPNVKGWDGGAAWLSSQTLLTRENFANALVKNPKMLQNATWLTENLDVSDPRAVAQRLTGTVLQGDVGAGSLARLVAYLSGTGTSALGVLSGENFDERVRAAAYLTMAMPAYQLS